MQQPRYLPRAGENWRLYPRRRSSLGRDAEFMEIGCAAPSITINRDISIDYYRVATIQAAKANELLQQRSKRGWQHRAMKPRRGRASQSGVTADAMVLARASIEELGLASLRPPAFAPGISIGIYPSITIDRDISIDYYRVATIRR